MWYFIEALTERRNSKIKETQNKRYKVMWEEPEKKKR